MYFLGKKYDASNIHRYHHHSEDESELNKKYHGSSNLKQAEIS